MLNLYDRNALANVEQLDKLVTKCAALAQASNSWLSVMYAAEWASLKQAMAGALEEGSAWQTACHDLLNDSPVKKHATTAAGLALASLVLGLAARFGGLDRMVWQRLAS